MVDMPQRSRARLLSISLFVAMLTLNSHVRPDVMARAVAQNMTANGSSTKDKKASDALDLADLDSSPSEMRSAIERYTVDRASLNRFYTITGSATRTARLKQFYGEWLARLAQMNFDAMSQAGRVDYLLFKNQLEYEQRQLDIQARQYAETELLIPFAKRIIEFEESRRRMEPINSAKTADALTRLSRQIEDTRKSLEATIKPAGKGDEKPTNQANGKADKSKIKQTVANRAVVALNNLRNMLKDWCGFFNGYDPQFTWWAGEPYKQADKALQDYAAFVREKFVGIKPDDTTTIIGDPIGREALISELAYEMIPYTPEELIAIAKKEMDWCEAEMIKASRALGYGDNWHKALEYVKTLYVEPGKQPDLIRQLATEAIAFVDEHDLVTVPKLARDTWRMEMMSPERQLVSPFFLGGETILVSYPTNTMTHEQKMMSIRGNNIHFSRATVFHELIPGHHLQGFMAQRYRTYRGLFGTPFWTEGWALYWEMLLWDMNFAKSPENRIGMLFWRMHRSARIMFSLGFHLEQMTPQQCIDLLVKGVGHEPDNATAEVRRSFIGTYGPLYQCAYLLGGLQFRALHKDLVESGKLTNRAFHDAILKENRIPVEMVRAILTSQPLARDFKSSWKFYGPNPAGR
jgi:uncharacterized protein (DUF885 family)